MRAKIEKKKKIMRGIPQSLTYRYGLCRCDMDKTCIEKKSHMSLMYLV